MKKTQEVVGLPIISISDGSEVGKVKDLIINAEKGTVDFIVVDNGTQVISANVIPTEKVLGIGEYALTIETGSDIGEISKIPAAVDLLQKNVKVRNTKILTKKGRLIGETGDIFIDEDKCCGIAGLEYITDAARERIRIIPRESVITFGKNLIVVIEDVEASLLDDEEQLVSGKRAAEAEKKNLAYSDSAANPDSVPDLHKTPEDTDVRLLSKDAGNEQRDDIQSNISLMFEDRQKQYIRGRRAAKTITDNSGNVIISEGMIITDEVIDKAKREGKLIDLVMNNKA